MASSSGSGVAEGCVWRHPSGPLQLLLPSNGMSRTTQQRSSCGTASKFKTEPALSHRNSVSSANRSAAATDKRREPQAAAAAGASARASCAAPRAAHHGPIGPSRWQEPAALVLRSPAVHQHLIPAWPWRTPRLRGARILGTLATGPSGVLRLHASRGIAPRVSAARASEAAGPDGSVGRRWQRSSPPERGGRGRPVQDLHTVAEGAPIGGCLGGH